MAVAVDWQRVRSPETRKHLAALIATMVDEEAKSETDEARP